MARIGITRSLPRASPAASRVRASSCCTGLLLECRLCGVGAGDAAERGADAHADTGGVSLAQHVAGHHLAGDEEVVAGPAAKAHGRRLVDLQAEVREGDPGLQRIAVERWRVD